MSSGSHASDLTPGPSRLRVAPLVPCVPWGSRNPICSSASPGSWRRLRPPRPRRSSIAWSGTNVRRAMRATERRTRPARQDPPPLSGPRETCHFRSSPRQALIRPAVRLLILSCCRRVRL
jgi:hypothetical protein